MSGTTASRQSQPGPVSARARLRPKSQLTLPEDIRRALRVHEGDEVEFRVQEDGTVTVRGYVSVPTDHAWLYVERQHPSRESDSELTGRQLALHQSAESMFTYLDSLKAADT